MSKTRKIKILSDGERFTSNIVDAETGEPLRNIMKATIIIEGPEPPQVTLEVLAPAMDITATAEQVQTGWLIALYDQLKEMRALLERLVNHQEVGTITGDIPGVIRDARALLEKYPADEEASDGE